MTTIDIDAMIAAADLADATDRLILADALTDAERDDEANLLRSGRPVRRQGGHIVKAPAYVLEMHSPCGTIEERKLLDRPDRRKCDSLTEYWVGGGEWRDGAILEWSWILYEISFSGEEEEIDSGSGVLELESGQAD